MLTCQWDKFELEQAVSYINCAYMSPQLKSVTAAGEAAFKLKARPYKLTIPDFFEPVEQLKQLFSKLIEAQDPQRISIIPAVSYGMANVVNNIKLSSNQHVLLADEQFPSNYYAWKNTVDAAGASLKIVSPPDSLNRTSAWNERILSAINKDTAAVSMAHTHWADGTLFDLKAIRKRTNEVGALLIIDGTQSVGALPISMQEVPLDALICGAYKWLFGPYSIGMAYYGERFDHGQPIEESWVNRKESHDFKNLVNYQSEYRPKANRYSVGESSNFFLVPMAIAALQQLLAWGIPNIQTYCQDIAKEGIAALRERGCQIETDAQRANHLFGIRLSKDFDAAALKQAFVQHQVHVSMRGDAIRIAPHVYNTKADFEKLVSCFSV